MSDSAKGRSKIRPALKFAQANFLSTTIGRFGGVMSVIVITVIAVIGLALLGLLLAIRIAQ